MEKLSKKELKNFLDEKAEKYNSLAFIETDPIQIPHQFEQKEDIEIAAFLTATISWGNRKSIITNANKMMQIMGQSPYDFIMNYTPSKVSLFDSFVHRTFNAKDLAYFVVALQHIYKNLDGMETLFANYSDQSNLQTAIHEFKKLFFELAHPVRTQKHISDPLKGSAAKRINMFLRWMIRNDTKGVDFGIWKSISPGILSCPLDIHSGNVARKLGLLTRKQNDARAVTELDTNLRKLNPKDPVIYDFALFGLGVFEKF
ncbi:TIGR02757 family protein [Ascidiimonas sp. W6]|uniref:TIGR02757 family protein n=1 Tax=Ascidiimonas meishanensis TaxID=3128903 RepID=UPI0030EC2415